MKRNFCFWKQFDKRNGSTRAEVVHDAIQVANIADLVSNSTTRFTDKRCDGVRVVLNRISSQYFRTINTRVSVVYIETWKGSNQAQIDKGIRIDLALLNFNNYVMRSMYHTGQDTTQLLT